MANLDKASRQLFQRQPDECFPSIPSLWQHCFRQKSNQSVYVRLTIIEKRYLFSERERSTPHRQFLQFGLLDGCDGVQTVERQRIKQATSYIGAPICAYALFGPSVAAR